jgi:hypothetical protein
LGPRLTSAQRDAISSPPKGLEVFNTTTNQKNVYNGSAWVAVGSGSGGGDGVNLLTMNGGNNDAEQGTNGWAATGGTFGLSTPGSPQQLNGLSSFTFIGGAGQFVDSTAYATPNAFLGRKCQVHLPYYQYGGANGDYSLQVIDGNGNMLVNLPIPATNQQNSQVFQAFDCPTPPTTLKLRIASNATTIVPVVFDDAFLGQGRRAINTFGAIQQALQYTGSIVVGSTSGANGALGTTTLNQAGYARYGDHAFLSYDLRMTTAGTSAGGEVLFQMPLDKTTGQPLQFLSTIQFTQTLFGFGTANTNRIQAPNAYPNFNFTDNNTEIAGWIVPWDATRFRVCGYSTNVNTTTVSGCIGQAYAWGDGNVPKVMTIRALVPIQGWSAERAPVEGNTYDTVGWRIDAVQAGTASPSVSTGVVPAPGGQVEFGSGLNFSMQNVAGRGSITAVQACAAGVAPSSTCSGNTQLGIGFSLPQAQDVKVCAQFSHVQGLNNNGAQETYWKLYETPLTVPTTNLQGGKTTATAYSSTVYANAQSTTITLCENFTFSSAGMKVIRLTYYQPSSTGVNDARVLSDGAQGRGIRWTVEPLNQEMPAPVFTSIAQKLESTPTGWRVEAANIQGGSCAIINQTGFIATSVASGTNNGYCTLGLVPGKFSAPPVCQLTEIQGGTVAWCTLDGGISNTSLITACWNPSNIQGVSRSITCMGPK